MISSITIRHELTRVQQPEATGSYPAHAQDLTYDADGNLTQARSYGDANCDGTVNNFDVDAFVLAVADPEEYETEFPTCDILNCDMNGDGLVNNFDLDPFVGVLTASGIGPVVLMNFEWDAENRLVAVWPATPLVADTSKKWV